MELNVIDLSKDGEQRRERLSAKKASGEDIRLWAEVSMGEDRRTISRSYTGRNVQRQASSGRPARDFESDTVKVIATGRPPAERRRPAEKPRPRPVRPEDVQIYEREPARRSRPGNTGARTRAQKEAARDARARQERLRRKKRRRRKQIAARLTVLVFLAGVIVMSMTLLIRLVTGKEETRQVVQNYQTVPQQKEVPKTDNNNGKPFMTEDFLPVNDYSRPGEALEAVNNIFVHYTANRGTSAAQNRSYFENLATTGETSASAHFIIGYEGEIIQCIPLDEIGYAVMGRNYDSISIECCYLQEDGKFTEETYQSLIRLCSWLLKEYQLTPQDMRRHYDEGGKKCPLYFTEHVEEWERFKQDLDKYMQEQNSV